MRKESATKINKVINIRTEGLENYIYIHIRIIRRILRCDISQWVDVVVDPTLELHEELRPTIEELDNKSPLPTGNG